MLQMQNNKLNISQPVLKGSSPFQEPIVPSLIPGGICFDPFAAMINHSCEQNTWWLFEDRQLRVRASKDIAAGEEITFTYGPALIGDFATRKHVHGLGYNFNCTCDFCKKVPLGPAGALPGWF